MNFKEKRLSVIESNNNHNNNNNNNFYSPKDVVFYMFTIHTKYISNIFIKYFFDELLAVLTQGELG
jgi:hypothetical protein